MRFYDARKGFGFLGCVGFERDVFFRRRDLPCGFITRKSQVRFTARWTDRGPEVTTLAMWPSSCKRHAAPAEPKSSDVALALPLLVEDDMGSTSTDYDSESPVPMEEAGGSTSSSSGEMHRSSSPSDEEAEGDERQPQARFAEDQAPDGAGGSLEHAVPTQAFSIEREREQVTVAEGSGFVSSLWSWMFPAQKEDFRDWAAKFGLKTALGSAADACEFGLMRRTKPVVLMLGEDPTAYKALLSSKAILNCKCILWGAKTSEQCQSFTILSWPTILIYVPSTCGAGKPELCAAAVLKAGFFENFCVEIADAINGLKAADARPRRGFRFNPSEAAKLRREWRSEQQDLPLHPAVASLLSSAQTLGP